MDKDIVRKLISKDVNYYKEIHDSLKSDTYFNTGLIIYGDIKTKNLIHFFFNIYLENIKIDLEVLGEVVSYIPQSQKNFLQKIN